MAIIIEQEQSGRSNAFGFLIWIVILLILGTGLYYLFFKKPDLVEVVAPGNFKDTQAISKITLDPGQVAADPRFQALKQRVSPAPLPTPGRPNPFLGF